jgi:predicted AlkP superfamily pyrophosphatase or phosphodiesterase
MNYRRGFCVLFFFFLLPVFAEDAATPKFKAENVVLLVIDGPRWSETWGDADHKYIPHLFGDLAKEGVVYTEFKNNGPTLTNPGHAALTTGHYQLIDNAGRELPKFPTLPQLWLKTSGQPATSAWLICSKDKLEVLSNCADADWKDKFRCSTDCGIKGLGSGYRDDAKTWEAIKTIVPRDHPRLVVINLMGPDYYAHGRDWDKYIAAIKACDTYAWEFWQLLQKDPVYANKTALFVTDDHGRHADGHFDGFVSHGDDCPSCRHILCLAAGPDFKKNVVLDTKREQIDVAVTMAAILGVQLPGSTGKFMDELLDKK